MDENKLELLRIAGLEPDGKIINNYYVIDLHDYETFNKVYNRLEKNIEVERDSDQTSLDEDAAHVTYIFKDVLVELVALFYNDNYSLNLFEED